MCFYFSDTQAILQGVEEPNCLLPKALQEPPKVFDEEVEKNWLEYWQAQESSLVWQSWLDKYGSYVNPDYQSKETYSISSNNSSNEEISRNSESADPSIVAEWAQLWEQHNQEQYKYYHNWFYLWWTDSQANTSEVSEEKPLTDDCATTCNQDCTIIALEHLSIHIPPTTDFDIRPTPPADTTPEESEMESPVVKEQRDKSVVEKTQEFLKDLGFQTSSSHHLESTIKGCSLQISKKKRKKCKKKKVDLGLLMHTSAGEASRKVIPKIVLIM